MIIDNEDPLDHFLVMNYTTIDSTIFSFRSCLTTVEKYFAPPLTIQYWDVLAWHLLPETPPFPIVGGAQEFGHPCRATADPDGSPLRFYPMPIAATKPLIVGVRRAKLRRREWRCGGKALVII